MEVVLDSLATHRLARLVASDIITQPYRDGLIRWAYARRGDTRARTIDPPYQPDWTQRALTDGADAPKLATLVVCRWCASAHVAIAVVLARRFAPRLWDPAAKALAFSSVAGLLGVWEHFTEPTHVEIDDDEA